MHHAKRKIGNLPKERMMRAGMAQIVKKPTHHTPNGESIIYLIFTNISMKISGVKHITMGDNKEIKLGLLLPTL